MPSIIVSSWPGFDEGLDRRRAPQAPHLTLADLKKAVPATGLAWIYFGDIDEAGHRHGADSPEYLAAAQQGDSLVGELVAALDLRQDVLIALSDHGHRGRGGHGGDEPEVQRAFFLAIGAAVRHGVRLGPARTRDVCSTIAALVGLPPPRDNLGTPLLDILDRPEAVRARVLAPLFAQRSASDVVLLPSTPGDADPLIEVELLRRGNTTALGRALAILSAHEQEREGRVQALLQKGETHRLYITAGILILFLGGFLFLGRRNRLSLRARDLFPLLIYSVVFLILYFLDGNPLSFSIARGQVAFTAETALIGLLAIVATRTAVWLGLMNRNRQLEQSGCILFLWALYIVGAAAAGSDPAWLAGPRTSFLVIFLSTMEFYAALMFAFLALTCLRRQRVSSPDSPVPARSASVGDLPSPLAAESAFRRAAPRSSELPRHQSGPPVPDSLPC
jgi:hypothetical protein